MLGFERKQAGTLLFGGLRLSSLEFHFTLIWIKGQRSFSIVIVPLAFSFSCPQVHASLARKLFSFFRLREGLFRQVSGPKARVRLFTVEFVTSHSEPSRLCASLLRSWMGKTLWFK